MIGRTIDELAVGDSAELSRLVTDADIAEFADAVGDFNPVHSDPVFAATTPFRGPIVPGIWTAGLLSAVIGTRLPGPGSIYVTQDLKFLKPVRVSDTITARAEVLEIVQARNRIRLKTVCLNQRGDEVLVGEAWVLPPKSPVVYADDTTGLAALTFWTFQPFACAARALSLWWMVGASTLALAPTAITLRARR